MWIITDLLRYLLGGLMQVVAFIVAIGFPGYFIVLLVADNPLGNVEYIVCFVISLSFWSVIYQTEKGFNIINKYLKTAFLYMGG